MDTHPVFENIRSHLPKLTKSEARVARYILNNEAKIGLGTGASLAKATSVSEITVSRLLRKLGYKGLREMKSLLASTDPEGVVQGTERRVRLLSSSDSTLIDAESQAIRKLATQLSRPEWEEMIGVTQGAERIFVTGFQTARGMAEDFARRLGIVRDAVRFLSVRESGLVEWVPPAPSILGTRNVLILIDILPYAKEAEKTCAIARRFGFDIVVLTDEFNNWAYAYTKFVFHAESTTGLFLESTAALNSMLNFIVHSVAEREPDQSRERIDNWMGLTKELDLF
ncbi:MAG: MurR/RpiR family transcriptional regulator [Paracoccaceae bacterium]